MGVPDSLDRTADVVRDLCAAPVSQLELPTLINDCCDTDQTFVDSCIAFQRARIDDGFVPGEAFSVKYAENLLRLAAMRARGQTS